MGIFRYTGDDVTQMVVLADQSVNELGDDAAAGFLPNLPGSHARTVSSLEKAAERKASAMKWAYAFLLFPLGVSPFVAILWIFGATN